jgi:hypothetical protein
MIRLYYRLARRQIANKLHDEKYVMSGFFPDLAKWWFDFARNLLITSIFAYFALHTGSWFAYAFAHVCFIFLTLFLFHPLFIFIGKTGSARYRQRHSYKSILLNTWLILVLGSFALLGTQFLVYVLAKYQVR